MTKILDQTEIIRDFINSPRKQHLLLSKMADWNKLCSSLDVVEDTELSIESYTTEIKPKSVGETYLITYGILQVLFVQQNAIQHIAESLHLQYKPDTLLLEIREARNDSVGHPTERGQGKVKRFNFINRSSMTATGFQLMTTYSNKVQSKFTDINIPNLVKSQRAKLTELLSSIIQTLRDEEMTHRKEFKDEKLTNIFPHTLDYYCEKMYESIWGNMPKSFASGMVDLVNKHIAEYKNALSKRGLLDALENVKHLFDQLVYPLEKLKCYFSDTEIPKIDDKEAQIFIYFVREHLRELRDIAQEIDSKYESEP